MFCSELLGPLWPENEFWNTNDPQLTPCFLKTILIWIPCGLLFIFILFYYCFDKSKARKKERPKNETFSKCKFCICKQASTCILVFIASIRFIGTIALEMQNYGYVDKLETLSLALFCECMIILALLTRRDIQKNLPRQGNLQVVSFAFFIVCGIPELCYKFNFGQSTYNNITSFDNVTYICQFIFFCIAFVLFSISHKPHEHGKDAKKNVWPNEWASLPSRIFLTYVWKIIIKGYKGTLALDDIWEIEDTPECAQKAYETFSQIYEKRKQTRLSLVLLRVHWRLFSIAMFLVFCKSLLAFGTVFGLCWLIALTGNSQEPRWHGFIYVGVIFFSELMRILCWRIHDLLTILIGMRIRTALSIAVFRKGLRLSPAARRNFGSGVIINLISVDTGQCAEFLYYCSPLLTAPLQVSLGIYMFYNLVGNAIWSGMAVIIFVATINLLNGNFSRKFLAKQFQQKDQRLRLMSDLLNSIKSIKLYAWEPAFQKMINRVREFELKYLNITTRFYCGYQIFYNLLIYMFCIAIFATYTLGFGKLLTAEIAFSAIVLLVAVFDDILWFPTSISAFLSIIVSMKRLDNFFAADDIVEYVDRRPFEPDNTKSALTIENGQFKWSLSDESILDKINLDVPPRKLVAVIGTVGSGKSSLLSAAVGDMYITSGNVIVSGRVAYVPQQAWILNDTVRENILFGNVYNKQRYETIIAACELEADLAILPAGDFTEIGEKGVTLSGGQKQRISLARAVYQDCDIYLLDDPLSAVDVHVQKELFQKVVGSNGLLGQKTRILVTHALNWLPQCDEIVILQNGLIIDVGNYEAIADRLPHMRSEFDIKDVSHDVEDGEYTEVDESLEETSEITLLKQEAAEAECLKSGKLVEAEAVDVGRISWASFWLYCKSCGLFLVGFVVFLLVSCIGDVFFFIVLQEWTDTNANITNGQGSISEISNSEGTSILVIIAVTKLILSSCSLICYLMFVVKASRIIHSRLLTRILRSPATFFDTNPAGRVLNRFSKDMDTVDNVIPRNVVAVSNISFLFVFRLIPSLIATPFFGFVALGAVVAFIIFQRFYANSSRQFQRLEAITRSPIYSCAHESLQGADNIRIFGKQAHFYKKFDNLMNTNTRVKLTMLAASKWLDIHLSIVGDAVLGFAALLAITTPNITPGLVGMSIASLAYITETMRWGCVVMEMLEREMVALERINGYLHLESEAPWLRSEMVQASLAQKQGASPLRKIATKVKRDEESQEMLSIQDTENIDLNKELALTDWPNAGQIKFINYSAKYRKDLSLALKNVNLAINGGEKVGIVGRTGAGKSSMTLALCRFLEAAEGKIYIDDVDISQLGLHELRGKITVIPQDPALFTGSLRQNIDPFESFTDDVVWQALEQSHIKNYVSSLPEGLQHSIEEGGGNLSVGQRQLICLARAILRRSKILILDEPTASIDKQTDELIQATIRQQFKDCTVITVAHRLETVMDYDSIAVLAEGRILEYGLIKDLLSSETSEFRRMATKSGLAE